MTCNSLPCLTLEKQCLLIISHLVFFLSLVLITDWRAEPRWEELWSLKTKNLNHCKRGTLRQGWSCCVWPPPPWTCSLEGAGKCASPVSVSWSTSSEVKERRRKKKDFPALPFNLRMETGSGKDLENVEPQADWSSPRWNTPLPRSSHFFFQKKVLIMWLYNGQRLKAKPGFVFDHLFD